MAKFCLHRTVGLALLLATASAPAAVAQQVIQGRVFDAATDQAVEGAHVFLVARSGRTLDRVQITNKHGVFIMPVEQGIYKLRIKRIGFDSVDTEPIDVKPKVNVMVNYAITPRAIRLTKIDVKERSGLERGREGMAKREPLGKGKFLYEKDIREIASLPVYEILGRVEGLNTWADGSIRSLQGNRCLQFLVNRLPVTEIPDSKLTMDAQFASLYQMLPNGIDIAGVEIYRQFSEVPKEFQFDAWPDSPTAHGATPIPYAGTKRNTSSMYACGLINIWTRGAW